MTPLLQADAWAYFHSAILAHIPDEALAESDYGIDITWCAAFGDAFPHRPACLVLFGASAVHLNTNSIKRFMNASTQREVRKCAGTCRFLRANHRRFFGNYTHDSKLCWESTGAGLVPTGRPRYLDSHGFWKAGSFARPGSGQRVLRNTSADPLVVTATGKLVTAERR